MHSKKTFNELFIEKTKVLASLSSIQHGRFRKQSFEQILKYNEP